MPESPHSDSDTSIHNSLFSDTESEPAALQIPVSSGTSQAQTITVDATMLQSPGSCSDKSAHDSLFSALSLSPQLLTKTDPEVDLGVNFDKDYGDSSSSGETSEENTPQGKKRARKQATKRDVKSHVWGECCSVASVCVTQALCRMGKPTSLCCA